MDTQVLREMLAHELDRFGERTFANRVRSGDDNSHGGRAALAALEAAANRAATEERERCHAIVSAARFGEVDQDFRAICHMIDGGLTVEQIKS